ncbi:MAG TPA: hypothetical protein VL171_13465 [Verrucomicrobiae bacterium]|nr:hypothetical protein [Verrucomicrobiae bacterium]
MTQWLWIVILLILLAQPWRTMMVASDGDTCMHWRVGEWMLQHHQILRRDVFSYTRLDQPFISKEWLSEIIFAEAGRWAGLYGLAVVAALLIATTFAWLHRQLLREGNDYAVAIFVTLIAAWAACTHWLARPHAFTFLLAVLWVNELRCYEKKASARRLYVVLPVLTLLWVNLHGGYLAGFVTLGIYWWGAIIEWALARNSPPQAIILRRKLRAFTVVLALCGVVSLINPNGYKLHLHNLQFLHSTYLTNWLAEYGSPDFHAADSLGFLMWLGLMFLTLTLTRPRLSPTSGLMLLVWTYFALYAVRNIPLCAIFTAPIIAAALTESATPLVKRISNPLREIHRVSHGGPLLAMIAVFAIVIPRPLHIPVKNWPVEAVEYIKSHPDQFQGNMFNEYVWGGYLLIALPDHRVFIDGRTDFYGESFLRQYDEISTLNTNWLETLQQYDVQWTLLPKDRRLNSALGLMPNWERVYSNQVATIFRKAQ